MAAALALNSNLELCLGFLSTISIGNLLFPSIVLIILFNTTIPDFEHSTYQDIFLEKLDPVVPEDIIFLKIFFFGILIKSISLNILAGKKGIWLNELFLLKSKLNFF